MPIAYDTLGEGSRTLCFLHGILGSRQNGKGFVRRLLDVDPRFSAAWRAVLVDLRGHGDSHGQPPPHTIAACAQDVLSICAPDVVIGHSFGGKVALQIARASSSVRLVAALDSPPGPRPGFAADGDAETLEEVARVIRIVRAQPLPIPGRRELVTALRAAGLSDALAQWMTTNLREAGGGGLVWKFDLQVVDELLRSFAVTDLWRAIEQEITGRVVLVRAGRSDRWRGDELARVERAAADGLLDDHTVDAGHWLHAEAPDAVIAALRPSLGALA